MSEQEFQKHWTETHAPFVEKWLAKHGVIRYVQVDRSTRSNSFLKQFMPFWFCISITLPAIIARKVRKFG